MCRAHRQPSQPSQPLGISAFFDLHKFTLSVGHTSGFPDIRMLLDRNDRTFNKASHPRCIPRYLGPVGPLVGSFMGRDILILNL